MSPMWFFRTERGSHISSVLFSPGVGRTAGIGSCSTWKLLTALQINEFLPGTTLAQEGAGILSFSVLTNCSTSGFDWLLTQIFSVSEHKAFLWSSGRALVEVWQAGDHPAFPCLVVNYRGSGCHACTWQMISSYLCSTWGQMEGRLLALSPPFHVKVFLVTFLLCHQ